MADASPHTTFSTPGGSPARLASSASASAVRGASSEGFSTTCAWGVRQQKAHQARIHETRDAPCARPSCPGQKWRGGQSRILQATISWQASRSFSW